jgi:hypothetical protein
LKFSNRFLLQNLLFSPSFKPCYSSRRSSDRLLQRALGILYQAPGLSLFPPTSPHFFLLFYLEQQPPVGQGLLIHEVLDHTQRRTTVSRTAPDERSTRRRDLYLTTHNTHNRLTSMPRVGFEPKISAGERPQTYALDRAVTGTAPTSLLLHPNIF